MSEAATQLVEDFIIPQLDLSVSKSQAEATPGNELTASPSGSHERYYLALEALHHQRRHLLKLKRLGDSSYRQDHYDELREYIDDFQAAFEQLENRQTADVVARLEALMANLIADTHGRPQP